MRAIKYKIYTLGCKVNQCDSSNISRSLNCVGFKSAVKNVDIVLVNTCCVTQTAIHKCKRMINKAKKENPKAKIAVIGCWPQIYQEEVKNLGIDIVWGVGEFNKLVERIKLLFKFDKTQPASQKEKIFWNKSRYFIKIQDGCEQFCSYCIIPYTRGKLKDQPQTKIIIRLKSNWNFN